MARLRSLLPRRQEPVIVALLGECHEVIGAFLRGQLLVMLALAVVYAVGLMLVGLELGLLIGVLAGLASIVPYMGFVVGIGAAVVAALFQFGLEPYPLLGVAAVFTVGQMLEGMLLTPLLVGDRIGLHPVAVILRCSPGGSCSASLASCLPCRWPRWSWLCCAMYMISINCPTFTQSPPGHRSIPIHETYPAAPGRAPS